MTLRRGHGTGAGVPRIEVLPPDEQPASIPADADPLDGVARRQNGTFAGPEAAARAGRKGGLVKGRRVRLARSLGLGADVTESEAFAPYRRSASAFRRHHTSELAAMAGGQCGSGPSSMVASAALQLAASRFLFDRATVLGDPDLFTAASRLADASRQNLMAAREMAIREAEARPRANAIDAVRARIMGPKGDE
jgi:hypothetical protein